MWGEGCVHVCLCVCVCLRACVCVGVSTRAILFCFSTCPTIQSWLRIETERHALYGTETSKLCTSHLQSWPLKSVVFQNHFNTSLTASVNLTYAFSNGEHLKRHCHGHSLFCCFAARSEAHDAIRHQAATSFRIAVCVSVCWEYSLSV
jgi:hypothetical protein